MVFVHGTLHTGFEQSCFLEKVLKFALEKVWKIEIKSGQMVKKS